jgi:type IV secretion system protein VirB6
LFLATTIGSLAALRIAGGLLLALAPLFAGLLLFDLTRGIFSGWLRGLALVALGSLGVTVLLSVQLAVTEPWLADALERRARGDATPTTPTEMLALTLAFAIATAACCSCSARSPSSRPGRSAGRR